MTALFALCRDRQRGSNVSSLGCLFLLVRFRERNWISRTLLSQWRFLPMKRAYRDYAKRSIACLGKYSLTRKKRKWHLSDASDDGPFIWNVCPAELEISGCRRNILLLIIRDIFIREVVSHSRIRESFLRARVGPQRNFRNESKASARSLVRLFFKHATTIAFNED